MGDRYFPVIILSTESPRILAEMERNAQPSRPATPALSILLNALFVFFNCIFSKPQNTLKLLKEAEEWAQWTVGSVLLQMHMFIRSAKHTYKVSWQGRGGRHVASGEMNCTPESFRESYFTLKVHVQSYIFLNIVG